MLMVLGLFVFERRTLPYQSMIFTKDFRITLPGAHGRAAFSQGS